MDHRLLVSSLFNRRSSLRMLATLWFGIPGKAPVAVQDDKAKAAPTVYTPGGDVKPPKLVHYVEPSFEEITKEAFVNGVVRLKTTVTPSGLPTDIEVTKGLSAAEDRVAMNAVKQWRFEPGTKAGEAVHVRVGIEIAFHLM